MDCFEKTGSEIEIETLTRLIKAAEEHVTNEQAALKKLRDQRIELLKQDKQVLGLLRQTDWYAFGNFAQLIPFNKKPVIEACKLLGITHYNISVSWFNDEATLHIDNCERPYFCVKNGQAGIELLLEKIGLTLNTQIDQDKYIREINEICDLLEKYQALEEKYGANRKAK